MGFFRDFLVNKFPYYYREFDTYKDTGGNGIFTRFVMLSGDELDTTVIPDIQNVINQKIAWDKNNKHIKLELLQNLNEDLGSVNLEFLDEDQSRRLLHNIMDIYLCKGTITSYEKLFFFYGYEIVITITQPANYIHDQFDETGLLDIIHDTSPITHDVNCINSCPTYNIELTPITDVTTSTLTTNDVKEIIKILNPLRIEIDTVTIN